MTQPPTLPRLAGLLSSGDLDLATHIDSICSLIDAREPQIEALLPEPGRRARLLAEAAALRERFPDPAARPPLFGVLVGVKDIFHVDGFPTRAGSALPPEELTAPEAGVVAALRAMGALVLGKTVTTEFAHFAPGPTRNPRNPDHTPGGSSSGSAAAVAAGYCPLALGTQTIGSVIRPAAFCGIVGYKPSLGRIDRDGLILCTTSTDHVGLFTRDAAGMRFVAALLVAGWGEAAEERPPTLGVPEGPYLAQAAPEALAAFEGQLARLERAGCRVRRAPALGDIEAINHRHRRLVAAEMAQVHAAWFAAHGPLYRERTAAVLREGQQVGAGELAEARASQGRLRAELTALMDAEEIDLWACPAAPGPAPRGIAATGDPAMNLPWTHAGMPAVSLPAGDIGGLPLGLQLVGRFGADERLLGWAEALSAWVERRD